MMPDVEPLTRMGVSSDKLQEFARVHALSELAIFGSVLREDFRSDSDIDILFELQPGNEMSIEKFLAMKDELEALFGREVHLVRKRLVQNPYRRAEILRTRKVLYAA